MVGSEPSELAFAAVEAKIRRPVHRPGLVARTEAAGGASRDSRSHLAHPADRAGGVREDDRAEPVGG